MCVAGADIHVFRIGARTPAAGATPVPLVLTHGRPSSFFEFLPLIGPLTDPVAHGADPADAFDVVLPSLPGFGFPAPLPGGQNHPARIADLWAELMDQVLGPAVDLPGRLQQTGALQRGQGQQQPGQRRGEYGSSGNLRPGRQLTIEATVNPE